MRDKVLRIIAILAIAGGAFLDAKAALGGDGTEDNPLTINSSEDWDEMVRNCKSPSYSDNMYFKITADLSGLTSGLQYFRGNLDGDGHTITFENVDHGFISTANGANIKNLEVRGTLNTKYIYGNMSTITLTNSIVNLTTSSSETTTVINGNGNFNLENSIIRFGDLAWVNGDDVNSGRKQAYIATFDPDIRPGRTGGTAICNGKGIAYTDGFRTGGIEGFTNGAGVTIRLPGIKIENYTISGTTAIKPSDSTISFFMPDKAVSLSITQRSITYVNSVRNEVTTGNFTILNDDGTMDYPAGTYVVSGDLVIDPGISFGGGSTIIVADGSKLSISNKTYKDIQNGIHADGNLTISGQQGGTGTIDIDMKGLQIVGQFNNTSYNCIEAANDVKVNDCDLNLKINHGIMGEGFSSLDMAGIRAGNNVSFDNVDFNADNAGAVQYSRYFDYGIYAGGSITIVGSRVEATCTSHGTSMVAGDGNKINLTWRHGNDTFYVTSYDGTLKILNNKYFHNGRNALTGEITNTGDVYSKRLTPAIDLWDGGTNSTRIGQYDGEAFTVFLDDRTLFKDGAWNTLTLPFSLDESKTAALLDGNGILMALDTESTVDGHKTGLDGGVLYLNFTEAKAITAGKPYIIKWTGGDNLTEPLFEGVTISKGDPQPVTFSGGSFVGNYDEVKVGQADAFRYIILAGGNKLGYSAVGSTLHNFRAHFEIDDPTEVKACQLSFGEAGTTGIIPIKSESAAQGIYTLDGLRLESAPTRKGIYIKDGKKVMVND